MSTFATASSSLWSAIAKSASTITAVLNATSHTVDMADRYVNKISTRQALAYKADELDYTDQITDQYTRQAATREVDIAEFRATSEAHNEFYEIHHKRFSDLFNPEDSETTE